MYFNLFIRFSGIGISLITLLLLNHALSAQSFSKYVVLTSLSAFIFIAIDFGLCKIILKQHALNAKFGASPNLYVWLGKANIKYISLMVLLSYVVILIFKGHHYSIYSIFLALSIFIINLSGEALKGQRRPTESIIVTSFLPSLLTATLIVGCYLLKWLSVELAIVIVGSMNIFSGFCGLFYSSRCSKGLHLAVSKTTFDSRFLISLNNATANLYDNGMILLLSALGLDKVVVLLALTSKVGLLFKSIFTIGCTQYMPTMIEAAHNLDTKSVLKINKSSSQSMYKIGVLAVFPVLFYSAVLVYNLEITAFVVMASIISLYIGYMTYLVIGSIQALPVILSDRSRCLSITANIFIFLSTSLLIFLLEKNVIVIHILISLSIIARGRLMRSIVLNDLNFSRQLRTQLS